MRMHAGRYYPKVLGFSVPITATPCHENPISLAPASPVNLSLVSGLSLSSARPVCLSSGHRGVRWSGASSPLTGPHTASRPRGPPRPGAEALGKTAGTWSARGQAPVGGQLRLGARAPARKGRAEGTVLRQVSTPFRSTLKVTVRSRAQIREVLTSRRTLG
jgi:hypothetical protein